MTSLLGAYQRGALPRGAKHYINCNPKALPVYKFILDNEPCIGFRGLDVENRDLSSALQKMRAYTLITRKLVRDYKYTQQYVWQTNPAFRTVMTGLIQGVAL